MDNEQQAKPKKKIILPIILAVILIVGGGYGIKTYLYSLHHVQTEDAQVDGNISPVSARVAGYVTQINFEDNQHVNAGDTLVKIDDRDLQIKLKQALAALQTTTAQIAVSKSAATAAQSAVDAASANVKALEAKLWKAEQDFNRYQTLLNEKSITLDQFENVKTLKETTEAQLDAAKQQVNAAKKNAETANEQVNVAQSAVDTKQADIDFINLQISYATIIAPVSGTVSKKNIQPGQLVQAGQNLFAIVSDSDVFVVANFKETQLGDMQKGQTANVEVDAFDGKEFAGTVYSFSAATGAKFSLLPPDNATGNFVKVVQRVPVKIKLNNLTASDKDKLKPGMNVKVTVNIN